MQVLPLHEATRRLCYPARLSRFYSFNRDVHHHMPFLFDFVDVLPPRLSFIRGKLSKWEYFPRIHSCRHCNLSGQPNLQPLAHSSLALIPFTKLCVVVLFLKWPVNSLPRVAKDPEHRQATRDRLHKSSRRCDLWIFHLTEIIAIFHCGKLW